MSLKGNRDVRVLDRPEDVDDATDSGEILVEDVCSDLGRVLGAASNRQSLCDP